MLNETKGVCNFCGEGISPDLRRCPYCGSLLDIRASGSENEVNFILVANSGDEEESKTVEQKNEHVSEMVEQKPVKVHTCSSTGKQIRKSRLSNGMKVFLTIISIIIPGLGQLAGIIISILFMNDENDEDRRSFGIALLVASLVFFVLSSFFWFIALLAVFSAHSNL